MKLSSAIVFVLLLNNLYGQQIFQGSIVYKYHFPEIDDAPEIMVVYGPNKLKIRFKEKDEWDKTFFLIDLDSGKSSTVIPETKTFLSRKLVDTTSIQSFTGKTIAGYKTNSSMLQHSNMSNVISSWSSGSIVLFTAPDLFYPVPGRYKDIPELIMIQNNHIVLGAQQTKESARLEDTIDDRAGQRKVTRLEAIRIDHQQLDMAEFSIPSDFKKISADDLKDTLIHVVDTVYSVEATEIPPPPPAKKKTDSNSIPPKKAKAIKTEAMKPKSLIKT